MLLTTYGRSSSFYIDPVEKKPQNHFLPGTLVLLFGTAGCNLACKSREIDTLADQASPEAGLPPILTMTRCCLSSTREERYQARLESVW